MPRARIVLLGVVIALISIVLTALAFVFVVPSAFPGLFNRQAEVVDGNGGSESRDVVYDPNDTRPILVALQSLPRGFTIPEDAYNNAVGVRQWPAASIPFDAIIIEDPENVDAIKEVIRQELIGKVMRTDVTPEQPLLRTYVVESLSELAREGSDIAALLPPGMEAIALPVDQLSSVGYGVQPGDHVDLIFTFSVLDVDEEFQSALPNWVYQVQYPAFTEDGGRITATVTTEEGAILGRIDTIPPGELANIVPSEAQRPRLVSQRAIVDAVVIYVGSVPSGGDVVGVVPESREGDVTSDPSRPAPDVIILGITPQDAIVITWAINAQVEINVAIRSVQDVPDTATSAVTTQYVFETYNVPVPPRLPYALEPSLRDAPPPTASPGSDE